MSAPLSSGASMKMLPIALALGALGLAGGLPAPAAAQSATTWPSAYRSLPLDGGETPRIVPLDSSGQERSHALPFPFTFNGVEYSSLNIGDKGYVTFGTSFTNETAASTLVSSLLTTGTPYNVVAAWWGNHVCSGAGGSVKTQVVGAAPSRRYVIQWECAKRIINTSLPTGTTFQAQLHLFEGSGIIRAQYGDVHLQAGNEWDTVGWGIKQGMGPGAMGPGRDGTPEICKPLPQPGDPKPKCSSFHFPSQTMIQYGLSTKADLTGSISAPSITLGETGLQARATIGLLNVGAQAASWVDFTAYLSSSPILDPAASGSHPIGSGGHAPPSAGGGSVSFPEEWSADRSGIPSGRYWLCLDLDPAAALDEFDRTNNRVCSSDSVVVGPDLVGSITAPASGFGNKVVVVPIRIENVGTGASGPFSYTIRLLPERMPDGTDFPEVDLYQGRISEAIPAGLSTAADLEVRLPQVLRADHYGFSLILDPDQELDEADRSNNVSFSGSKMRSEKPDTRITRAKIDLTLPDGCHYGEAVEASLEICNYGDGEAWGFHPGVAMGDGTGMSLIDDLPAATSPQICYAEGSANHLACLPVDGRSPQCVDGICRLSCEEDSDCAAGLVCGLDPSWAPGMPEVRRCMNHLAAASGPTPPCRTIVVRGRIPLVDAHETPYRLGPQRFFFVDDLSLVLNKPEPDQVAWSELLCDEALLDLSVESLTPSTRMIAGQASPITRTIHNLGFIERPSVMEPAPASTTFEYGYYLSTSREITPNQIPLEVRSTGGLGIGSIARKGSNSLTDLVVIPENVIPGTYYLGLVLDPRGLHRELSKLNNVRVFEEPIVVEAPSLRILSGTLPTAVAGARSIFSLVAVGGEAPYVWSASELPPGMSLSEDGVFSGVPPEAGIFLLRARVSSGSRSSEALLGFEVVRSTTSLEIVTKELPPARPNRVYGEWFDRLGRRYHGVQLSASGGVPPYSWELDPAVEINDLPQGLSGPSATGMITGTPTQLSQSSEIVVRVTDSQRNQVSATLSLEVVRSVELDIPSRFFTEGTAGVPYDGSCIDGAGGDTSAPYGWGFDEGTIPPGLEPQLVGGRLCLGGTPTECGNFMVAVSVEDAAGRRYAKELPLAVSCDGGIQIRNRFLAPMSRGQAVQVELVANAGDDPAFRIAQGALPAGLSLDEGGLLSGTVADDAAFGSYDFVVEVRSAEGRRGLTPLTAAVDPEAKEPTRRTTVTGGCASGAPSAGGPGLAILGLALLILRRSRIVYSEVTNDRGTVGGLGRARIAGLPLVAAFLLPLGFSLAGAGCGETTVVDFVSPCEEVSCGEGLSCDPRDGVCKCGGEGGAICKEGEVCALSPSPHCSSPACDFVVCEGGERCDPLTGTCGCAGAACAEGERCVDDVCVAIDRCEGVRCWDGLSCDPADGSCKCAGESCALGERCIEGACTFDRCHGVSCGIHDVCNPDDGSCHCGGSAGPICLLGEACMEGEEGFDCRASSLCEGVDCPMGTSCDPADGECRCGGLGGLAPICGSDQSCVGGRCLGGDLCAPEGVEKLCPSGLLCDSDDGSCKCGGRGGAVCGEDEVCTQRLGVGRCARACTLLNVPSGCATGEACYYDASFQEGRSFCGEAGFGSVDAYCDAPSDCQPGLYCSSSQRCRLLCRPSDGAQGCKTVSPQHVCMKLEVPGTDDVGYCITT